ncbi:Hydroxyacylglutathione hydrolase cytoplasmic [Sesamum angolense]|uniref:hydroxyacylglutathione hydrolase n=1 Tax=Sesamum angolense TaxID=2727404 RepID=A0AAE1W0G5_9LAMI|nr:Hydroxyacylglutathione hydrolase cytoplasmic [Sesamum angolense]
MATGKGGRRGNWGNGRGRGARLGVGEGGLDGERAGEGGTVTGEMGGGGRRSEGSGRVVVWARRRRRNWFGGSGATGHGVAARATSVGMEDGDGLRGKGRWRPVRGGRIIDEATKEAAVVDPVEPHKILRVAQENGVDLKLVLTTHHHWDHAGGNDKIKQLVPEIKIFGGSVDNVQGCTNKVENGDKLSLGTGIDILCLHTPCHTKGHISYYVTGKEGDDPAVFTGDTLFVAGCGKFFEGTAEQMYQSLCVTLGSLPKPTRVYCGHEYTVKNLQFASTVEPDNVRISQKLSWAEQKRHTGLPTVPSTIEEELETNPFMRVDLPEVQEKVSCKSPVDALREIRQRKDNWRG